VIRWDAQTGAPREVVYRGEDIRAVAAAPDGKMIAIAAKGGLYIRSSEADTFKEFQVPGHEDHYPFYVLSFSPDGKTIAGGGNGGLVQLCWPQEQIELCRLDGLTDRIHVLEFSPNGKLLACASLRFGGDIGREAVHVFDLETRRVKQLIKGHEYGVSALRISPDGKTLASCGRGMDHTVRLWDIATGKELWRQDAGAEGLAFSPDGKSLAFGGTLESYTRRDPRTGKDYVAVRGLNDLSIRDAATGKERFHVTAAHNDSITSVAYFPDGKRIVTTGRDHVVKVWDAATGKLLLPIGGHEEAVLSLAFAVDGKTLLSFGIDHTLRHWDVASGKEQDKLSIPADTQGAREHQWGYHTATFAQTADGKQLALVAEGERSILLFDSGSSKPRLGLKYPHWGLRSASFSCDGAVVASTSTADVRLWSAKTGELLRALDAQEGLGRERVKVLNLCATFSPTRPLLAGGGVTGRKTGWLELWDAPSARLLYTRDDVGQRVDHVAFSADGRLLAATGGDENPIVAVYEVATGALLGQFKIDKGTIHSAAFSPDGRLLAAGGDGGKNAVHVWDLYTGKELARLEGHQAGVLCVAFAPDGKLLASGSLDTTVLLWDVRKATGPRAAPAESEALPKTCWDDLARSDAKAGLGAVTALVRSPDRAVKLLKDELKPVGEPDAKQVRALIARLDDGEFAAREKASDDLKKLGDVVEPALKAALAKDPSLEAKRRLEALLAALDDARPTAGRLRQMRAVQVLEAVASPEARELLEALSKGAPAARLTRDSKEALTRIGRRPKD
jgi:WD40 repeat protein